MTKKGQKTRNKIISSAKELYKTEGYTSTCMQMIADKAKISKSLLTYYFPQKADILNHIIQTYLISILEFVKKKEESDALLQYLLTLTIYLKNIFKNKNTKNFFFELSKRTDERGLSGYGNFDILYIPILEQFGIELTEDEFVYRKIQMLGAHMGFTIVYENQVYPISDRDYIKQDLLFSCIALEIDKATSEEYIARSEDILKQFNYSRFKLLG